MIMGTIDFMIMSGFKTPIEAMPMPDLAVPYAAPKSIKSYDLSKSSILLVMPRAIATPICPKKAPVAAVVVVI